MTGPKDTKHGRATGSRGSLIGPDPVIQLPLRLRLRETPAVIGVLFSLSPVHSPRGPPGEEGWMDGEHGMPEGAGHRGGTGFGGVETIP